MPECPECGGTDWRPPTTRFTDPNTGEPREQLTVVCAGEDCDYQVVNPGEPGQYLGETHDFGSD